MRSLKDQILIQIRISSDIDGRSLRELVAVITLILEMIAALLVFVAELLLLIGRAFDLAAAALQGLDRAIWRAVQAVCIWYLSQMKLRPPLG